MLWYTSSWWNEGRRADGSATRFITLGFWGSIPPPSTTKAIPIKVGIAFFLFWN